MTWVKAFNPKKSLGLICRKGLGSTLKSLGIIDHYWEIQKGDSESYQKVLEEIKAFDIHFLISAHTSFRTTLFCSKIKATKKITFAKPWNFFVFDERVKWDGKLPEALRLLSLFQNQMPRLKTLFRELPNPQKFVIKHGGGKLISPPEWADLFKGWKPQDPVQLLQKHGLTDRKFIALFPGSVWATKMWKKEGFIELGQELQKKSYQIVIMGGAEEKVLGQEVAAQVPDAINLCGQTSLLESLTVMSQASLVVGNDSSSSHMAALVNVPIVAIYGPTVLKFGYRPWAQNSAVAEFEGLGCRPCGPHGHKQCPLGHHHCMKKLEVREVLRVAEGLL